MERRSRTWTALALMSLALAGCAAQTAPQEHRTTSPAASTEQSSLRGAFRYQSSREELAGSKLLMDGGEINDGNWGLMTMTFDGDAVEWTQQNSVKATQTRGTFTTASDLLVLRFTNGANMGETFTVNYTLDGDTLTLSRVPDGGSKNLVGPTPLILKPWERVS